MQTAIITADEVELIDQKIKPRNKRFALYVFLGLLVFSFITPFITGRYVRVSAYDRGEYFSALMIALFIFMLLSWYFYYQVVVCLNKDLQEGKKHIAAVKILSKKKVTDDTYEVVLDKGKLNIDKKITIPVADAYKWIKGDFVEVQFLKRSGTVLSYKNEQ